MSVKTDKTMGRRSFKFNRAASNILHRGHKFVKGVMRGMKQVPEGLKQLDQYGRQAANTLGTVADYGALASDQFQNDGLRDASNKIVKHAESINNFRRSAVANKARDQFWTPKEANPWDDMN